MRNRADIIIEKKACPPEMLGWGYGFGWLSAFRLFQVAVALFAIAGFAGFLAFLVFAIFAAFLCLFLVVATRMLAVFVVAVLAAVFLVAAVAMATRRITMPVGGHAMAFVTRLVFGENQVCWQNERGYRDEIK